MNTLTRKRSRDVKKNFKKKTKQKTGDRNYNLLKRLLCQTILECQK